MGESAAKSGGQIKVRFKGPVAVGPKVIVDLRASLLKDGHEEKSPGVYLWAYKDAKGKFVPLYVGETTNSIIERTREHLGKYAVGDYWWYDIDTLPEMGRAKACEADGAHDPGKPGRKQIEDLLFDDGIGRRELAKFLSGLYIFYSVVRVDKVLLKSIESDLIDWLRRKVKSYYRYDHDVLETDCIENARLSRAKENRTNDIKIAFGENTLIAGFDAEFGSDKCRGAGI